jgi:hypothetical protein
MNTTKWRLSLDVSDLGFVHFRKNPVNYSAAKTVEFRGITIPNLLNFNSQTFDELDLDSITRSFLPERTSNDYSLFMPFNVSLVFSKPLLEALLHLDAGRGRILRAESAELGTDARLHHADTLRVRLT